MPSRKRLRKPPPPPAPPSAERFPAQTYGRPTKYRRAYCEQVFRHLAAGYPLSSFAPYVNACRDTVHAWTTKYPEFSDAVSRGKAAGEDHYVRIGQGMSTGSLRRLAAEIPARNADGTLVVGPNGEVVYEKVYEAAKCNGVTFTFLMRNICGWTETKNLNIGGQAEGVPVEMRGRDPRQMTREEMRKEMAELAARRREREEE